MANSYLDVYQEMVRKWVEEGKTDEEVQVLLKAALLADLTGKHGNPDEQYSCNSYNHNVYEPTSCRVENRDRYANRRGMYDGNAKCVKYFGNCE